MKLSQTFYSIELLFPLNLDSDEDKNSKKEPEFITLCNLDYNPCISIREEINVPKWSLGYAEGNTYKEKNYSFNAKVIGIKREIHPLEKIFLVRYFVESEDRDLILEMCDLIKKNGLDEMCDRIQKYS